MPTIYDTKHTPIDQKFLSEGNRLMLQWREGWTFHTIVGRKLTRVKPFMRGLNLIAASGTQDFTELTDPNNNRIFDVTDAYAKNLMYHASVGVKPTNIRMYVKYPSGIDLRTVRSFPPVSLGMDINAERDYVTSGESPFQRPTDAMEMYFPWTLDATFGFVNTDPFRPHQVVLSVEMAAYEFRTLDPKKPSQLDIIKRMVVGKIPRTMFTLGFIGAKIKEFGLQSRWNVEPLPLEEFDASPLPNSNGGRGGGY